MSGYGRSWRYGLCGCFGDCTTCLLAFFCPCYVTGKNAEGVGESCCCHCLMFFIPILNFCCAVNVRGRVRAQRGIQGSCFSDLVCTFCFPFCTLVQASREVQNTHSGLYMLRE